MTFLLFQWSHWDYKYLQETLGEDCQVVFSKDCSQRVLRYLSGVVTALRKSGHGDTIVCWYDAQAVVCWWLCGMLHMERKVVCVNLLLKQKNTWKNRLVSRLYKKALTSSNFKSSVTSRYYGAWLNRKLGVNINYTLLHDVYHDYYEVPQWKEIEKDIVFCGGCYGRDWPLMMEIVKAMPETKFCLVMTAEMERRHFSRMNRQYPKNVRVLTDIPYKQFMYCLCQSRVVCMPLDCEAPQGLIVMYEAAANDKVILTSDTPTTQEYFDKSQRLGKDVNEWCEAIEYYLGHPDDGKERAVKFHGFLKADCNERRFSEVVKDMVESI